MAITIIIMAFVDEDGYDSFEDAFDDAILIIVVTIILVASKLKVAGADREHWC